jgi:MFS family permease
MGLILFFGIFYGIYLASVYKPTAQDTLEDHTLTLAGALGSVCNGGSRIVWASIQDKYGFKRVYLVLLIV